MRKKINFYNLMVLIFLCLFANISRADDCLTKYACLHPMTKGFFTATCRIENGITAYFIENESYPSWLDTADDRFLCSSTKPCFIAIDPTLWKNVKNTFRKDMINNYSHTPSGSSLIYIRATGKMDYGLGEFPDKDEWITDSETGFPICE